MNCPNCKYLTIVIAYAKDKQGIKLRAYHYPACKITNRIEPTGCFIKSDEDVAKMYICYNCANWLGGGDWGLSCRKHYYNTDTDGFTECCASFKRKN